MDEEKKDAKTFKKIADQVYEWSRDPQTKEQLLTPAKHALQLIRERQADHRRRSDENRSRVQAVLELAKTDSRRFKAEYLIPILDKTTDELRQKARTRGYSREQIAKMETEIAAQRQRELAAYEGTGRDRKKLYSEYRKAGEALGKALRQGDTEAANSARSKRVSAGEALGAFRLYQEAVRAGDDVVARAAADDLVLVVDEVLLHSDNDPLADLPRGLPLTWEDDKVPLSCLLVLVVHDIARSRVHGSLCKGLFDGKPDDEGLAILRCIQIYLDEGMAPFDTDTTVEKDMQDVLASLEDERPTCPVDWANIAFRHVRWHLGLVDHTAETGQPDGGSPTMTLHEFVDQHCEKDGCKYQAIQKAHSQGRIKLPAPVNNWVNGKKKVYREWDLREAWGQIRLEVPDAPRLKRSNADPTAEKRVPAIEYRGIPDRAH